MNIKEIVEKIWIEADIQKNEYPVENALQDINARILKLIGRARRIASREPISGGENFSEVFTVATGSNVFTRTIEDIPIFRVDFKPTGAEQYCRIYEDQTRGINTWCCLEGTHCLDYFADEKRIFIDNGREGEVRITYASGEFVKFELTDYNATPAKEVTWIPEEFQDLIWLYVAMRQAYFYKPERVAGLKEEIIDLQRAFDSHYGRNAQWDQQVVTDRRPNNR